MRTTFFKARYFTFAATFLTILASSYSFSASARGMDDEIPKILRKNFKFDQTQGDHFHIDVIGKVAGCSIEFAYFQNTKEFMLSLRRRGSAIGIDFDYLEKSSNSLVYTQKNRNGSSSTDSEIFLDDDNMIIGFRNKGTRYCDFQGKFPVEVAPSAR